MRNATSISNWEAMFSNIEVLYPAQVDHSSMTSPPCASQGPDRLGWDPFSSIALRRDGKIVAAGEETWNASAVNEPKMGLFSEPMRGALLRRADLPKNYRYAIHMPTLTMTQSCPA